MRNKSLVVLFLAVLVVALVPAAQAGLVTCRSGNGCLNGSDHYDWTANYGPPFSPIPNNSVATSVGGVTATVTFAGGRHGQRLDQGNGWSGNFTPGDELLRTRRRNGPVTFTFSQSLTGIGAQIETNEPNAFTAQLCDSNNVCVTEDGKSDGNGDGSAIFIGLTDANGFTSATFSVTACTKNCTDFAINQMDIIPGGSGVPEPGSLMLLGTGVLGMAGLLRRKLNF